MTWGYFSCSVLAGGLWPGNGFAAGFVHEGMLPQLRVSLQPSQASSSQIYPPCGIPENPHGMLSPGCPAGRSSPGRWSCSDSCSQGWSCSPLCLQLIYPLFTENRLIHSLILSLSTYLSSACQVPSGYPFGLASGSLAPLQRRKSMFSFNLQSKNKSLWCFSPSEARNLGRVGNTRILSML